MPTEIYPFPLVENQDNKALWVQHILASFGNFTLNAYPRMRLSCEQLERLEELFAIWKLALFSVGSI